MIKRIISVLIVLTMCLSMNAFAAGGKVEFSSSDYAPLLKNLDVVDDSALSASVVTRMTFLKSALRLLGNDALVSSGGDDVELTDVAKGSENYMYVKFAMNSGVISKSDSFRPNDSINYNEALKILVNILGYSSIAEAIGGYPVGYAKIARELGLDEGVSRSEEMVMSYSFITLLVNTLEASPASVSQIVDNQMDIKVNAGKPLMESAFNLHKGEGLVDATTVTSLYGASSLGKDEVRIADVTYECDYHTASEMLGAYCEFYYESKPGSSHKKIVFMIPSADENNIYEFESDSLEDVHFMEDKVSYFDASGNEKVISVSSVATYIYNGVVKGRSAINLSPDIGKITLIDNDSDKVMDVVKILDFKSSIVNAVSTSSDVIALKNGDKLEFDFDRDYITVIVDEANGDVSDITADKVISYYQTPFGDGSVAEIYVSDNVIIGAISEISDDSVYIEDKEYSYLPSLTSGLKLGITQKFYIDAFDVVCDIVSMDDVYVYGWLYGAIDEGMDKIKVKIFTENDRWVELYLADTVRTESGKVKKEEWFAQKIPAQLVRYKVNSDAIVTELLCAVETERFSENEKHAISNDTFRLSVSLENAPYRYGTASLENQVYFSSCGKIFYIPEGTSDTSAYEIISITKNFTADAGISNVKAYDMDVFGTPKAMVVQHAGLSRSYNDFLIFDSVTRSIGTDGSDIYRICGTFRGFEVKFPTADLSLTEVNSFNKGDILTVKFSTDGEVISVAKKYDIVADKDRSFLEGALYARDNCYICGEVLDVDQKQKRVIIRYGEETGVFAIAGTSFVTFDTDTEECRASSIADIIPGVKIFARMEYLRLMNVAIIE